MKNILIQRDWVEELEEKKRAETKCRLYLKYDFADNKYKVVQSGSTPGLTHYYNDYYTTDNAA